MCRHPHGVNSYGHIHCCPVVMVTGRVAITLRDLLIIGETHGCFIGGKHREGHDGRRVFVFSDSPCIKTE